MYFVDQKKIEEILSYMDQILEELASQSYNSFSEKLTLERVVHVLIESIIDVGNLMIDGFIMRDPGSYEDIIDILVDEKVIPKDDENNYKSIVGLRKKLVKDYWAIDHSELSKVVKENRKTLDRFSKHIHTYLKNELGVANAFMPD